MTKKKYALAMLPGFGIFASGILALAVLDGGDLGMTAVGTQMVFTMVYLSLINAEYGQVLENKEDRVLFPLLRPSEGSAHPYAMLALYWVLADIAVNLVGFILFKISVEGFMSFLIVIAISVRIISWRHGSGRMRWARWWS